MKWNTETGLNALWTAIKEYNKLLLICSELYFVYAVYCVYKLNSIAKFSVPGFLLQFHKSSRPVYVECLRHEAVTYVADPCSVDLHLTFPSQTQCYSEKNTVDPRYTSGYLQHCYIRFMLYKRLWNVSLKHTLNLTKRFNYPCSQLQLIVSLLCTSYTTCFGHTQAIFRCIIYIKC
jgi:hypothetical protein